MKTVGRILLVVCIAALIYFAIIGRDDFMTFATLIYEAVQVIAANYTKK
jgi:hypothetical protein